MRLCNRRVRRTSLKSQPLSSPYAIIVSMSSLTTTANTEYDGIHSVILVLISFARADAQIVPLPQCISSLASSGHTEQTQNSEEMLTKVHLSSNSIQNAVLFQLNNARCADAITGMYDRRWIGDGPSLISVCM